MTEALRDWLKQKEGLRLKPYTDTHGWLTVGYGRNLSANGISILTAEQMLDEDIIRAQRDVQRYLPWVNDIAPARQDAFYHLAFWIGIGSLLRFTKMIGAAHSGDWETASNELLNSALNNDIPERTQEIAARLLNG